MNRLFEDYLRMEHAREYQGLDDEMPDAFEEWIDNLEKSEIIALANEAMSQ